MQQRIKIGDQAKAFKLKDQDDREFQLSDFKGKKVLLSFHPLAWTSVCAEQMKSLEAHQDQFVDLATVPLGLSIDSVPCKKAWAKSLGIEKTRLLCDFWPHGGVAAAYGLFIERLGISERANVIIDEDNRVSFVKVYPIKELPDIEEIIRALA
jgi:peroxiredoxin